MIERKLVAPEGFDPAASPRVASFAGQLDDLLVRLRKAVAGLETRHLEWQPRTGMNTIGMLLAHLAVVDVWWMRMAPREVPVEDCGPLMREIIGIEMDDDGLPLPPQGRHPSSLSGKTLDQYLEMIERARAATNHELRRWSDADLATTYGIRDRVITREWTVYHVIEHFAGHFGQILLIKHMMRDAGLLPAEEGR